MPKAPKQSDRARDLVFAGLVLAGVERAFRVIEELQRDRPSLFIEMSIFGDGAMEQADPTKPMPYAAFYIGPWDGPAAELCAEVCDVSLGWSTGTMRRALESTIERIARRAHARLDSAVPHPDASREAS